MITKSLLDYYGVVHLSIIVLVFVVQRRFTYNLGRLKVFFRRSEAHEAESSESHGHLNDRGYTITRDDYIVNPFTRKLDVDEIDARHSTGRMKHNRWLVSQGTETWDQPIRRRVSNMWWLWWLWFPKRRVERCRSRICTSRSRRIASRTWRREAIWWLRRVKQPLLDPSRNCHNLSIFNNFYFQQLQQLQLKPLITD